MATGMAAAVEPDQQKDPWAWAQWAAQRDPATYNLRSSTFDGNLNGGADSATISLLRKAGLLDPKTVAWLDYQEARAQMEGAAGDSTPDYSRLGPEPEKPTQDLSALSGYRVDVNRGPGYTEFTTLRDKVGNIVSQDKAEVQHSMKSNDYMDIAKGAATVAAMAYGANALNGAIGGAGAGAGAAASDPLAAYMTTGAVEGSTIGGAAAGGGGAGAVGAGSMSAALASGGGTAATTAAPSAGGGFWNGTNFTGTAPLAGSSNLGATAMGIGDWVNLGQLALSAYGVSQASGAASDATNAAAGVAQGQLALSKEALDWTKQIWNEQAPDRKATQDRANAISDAQLEGMQFATGQAKELDAYNKSTFRPLEQRMVSEAAAYDTPERRMGAAASAAADVNMQTAQARKAAERNLGRSGIAPGSAKALALQEDMAVTQGRNVAGAMTEASRNVESQGFARMADAANLGRGIATNQATQQQIATTTGNSSVGNSATGLNAVQSGNALVPQGFSTAINGMNSAGNLFSSVARQQSNEFDQVLGGVGGITQFLGKTYGTSDKNKKTGTGKAADGKKALAEIEATKVESGWKYKDDPTQTPRMGAMAQEVNRVSGEAAAPGGKVIDLVSAQGRMQAAIQQLSKEVKALKKAAAKDMREDETEMEAA